MTSGRKKERISPGGEHSIVGKPSYESPRTVQLGELARGTARCENGYAPADECTDGSLPVFDCSFGTFAG